MPRQDTMSCSAPEWPPHSDPATNVLEAARAIIDLIEGRLRGPRLNWTLTEKDNFGCERK